MKNYRLFHRSHLKVTQKINGVKIWIKNYLNKRCFYLCFNGKNVINKI